VVMLDLDPWDLKPQARLAFSVEDIVEAVGPQYLWAPIFEVLNEAIFDRGMRNLAIVGTPCTAQAVRKIRQSTNSRLRPYQDALRLTISIFCTGVYRPDFVEEVIVKRLGVAHDQIKRLEISPDREWLRAVLWDDSVRTVPRQQAEGYTRKGCGSCDDYLGESADLAIGALGAPEGESTLIIRSRTGDIFVRNAVQMNLLETSFEVNEEALKAAASEKERRERAMAFRELRLRMLDALADPYKRGEAIQQFVRLYRTPAPTNVQEIIRSSCTGC
jgi:coenzyme F420 hydrogenase subunit beta